MTTTITEALADIKTTQARIDKKQQAIMQYVGRDSRLRDPLEKEGGSAEFIRRERQAISDLQEKVVRIRSAIQKVNLETNLTLEGETRTLSEWLNWRREVSAQQQHLISQLTIAIANLRQQAMRTGMPVRESSDGASGVQDFIVNLSEAELAKENERLSNILGQLDGKLSLINATTTIDV